MSALAVVKYPDPRLEEPTETVEEFGDELRALARDMVETMYRAAGIGLAAPQVGRSERICVIDLSVGADPEQLHVLVNPRVVDQQGEIREEEGCLSFPDLLLVVPRPARLAVEYEDLEGVTQRLEGEELLARCLHHEIDHLDGVLFIERVSPLKRDLARRKIAKRIRADDW